MHVGAASERSWCSGRSQVTGIERERCLRRIDRDDHPLAVRGAIAPIGGRVLRTMDKDDLVLRGVEGHDTTVRPVFRLKDPLYLTGLNPK